MTEVEILKNEIIEKDEFIVNILAEMKTVYDELGILKKSVYVLNDSLKDFVNLVANNEK
jgi:hypothetical protein